MVSSLVYYQLALLALLWLFVMLHLTGSKPGRTTPPVPAQPKRPSTTEIKPFEGLTQKPHCVLCERDAAQPNAPAPVPPDPMPPTNRRPRKVDTSQHFCPHAGCRYRGWLGRGNLRANGHSRCRVPASTNGNGSAKQWRPQTPAMVAGLTDHAWTLREVLLFRMPPWPQ